MPSTKKTFPVLVLKRNHRSEFVEHIRSDRFDLFRGQVVGWSRRNARDVRSEQKHERHCQRRHPFNKTKLIGAFVLFAGCKPDSAGVCNSEVDYVVIKPDGNVYAERKGQPLWKEQAPPTQNIQLSRAILGIRMESKDPTGEYKVRAKVSDLNAGITFELETKFRVK